KPRDGLRVTQWELLECSFCNVPVDANTGVTVRARRSEDWRLDRSVDAMQTALSHCERALDEHEAGGRHNAELGESLDRLHDHRRSAGGQLRALNRALEAGDRDQAQECLGRCERSISGMGRELRAIGDRHADASEAVTN